MIPLHDTWKLDPTAALVLALLCIGCSDHPTLDADAAADAGPVSVRLCGSPDDCELGEECSSTALLPIPHCRPGAVADGGGWVDEVDGGGLPIDAWVPPGVDGGSPELDGGPVVCERFPVTATPSCPPGGGPSAVAHLIYVERCGDEWWFGLDPADCLEPRCQALGHDDLNVCCNPSYPRRGHIVTGRTATDLVCTVGF
jgi:hypothetical protein